VPDSSRATSSNG